MLVNTKLSTCTLHHLFTFCGYPRCNHLFFFPQKSSSWTKWQSSSGIEKCKSVKKNLHVTILIWSLLDIVPGNGNLFVEWHCWQQQTRTEGWFPFENYGSVWEHGQDQKQMSHLLSSLSFLTWLPLTTGLGKWCSSLVSCMCRPGKNFLTVTSTSSKIR